MFFEKVSELCSKKGISISQLALDLKISKSNVTNWKNGSVPKSDKITQIANYFDVSTDYLLGKTSIKKEPVPDELEQAQKLNDMFAKYDIDIMKMSDAETENLIRFVANNKDFIMRSFHDKLNDKK